MNGPRMVAAALVASIAMLASCSSAGPVGTPVGKPVTTTPVVYVAVGASETVGVGTSEPFRDAWPRVLWRSTLPGAVFYDVGVSGSTVSQALTEQVHAALAQHPDIVTVWLNVNDLIARLPPTTYERQLDGLVHQLRDGGATQVLVANTPSLVSLPSYLACRPSPPPGSAGCPLGPVTLPPPSDVLAAVDAYNRAIARVTAREGAVLVDLTAFGDAPRTHPEYVSSDGFHPSSEGAEAVAQAFAAAIPPSIAAVAESPGSPTPEP